MYGSSYPIGKLGVNLISPILMSSMRLLLLFIVIVPFMKFTFPKKKFSILILLSLFMGVGCYSTLYLSISISKAMTPIIIGAQLVVPIGLILSMFIFNERISFKKWIYICTSFFGIVVVSYQNQNSEDFIAVLMVILMAIFFALSNILSKYLNDIDVITQLGWHCIVGLIFLIPISYIFEGNPLTNLIFLDYYGILIVLHASFFVTLLGHGGLFYLYKHYSVTKVLPFYFLFPIFGIILSFIIFFEIPNFFQIVGGIIVIGSVLLLQIEKKN